MNEVRYFGTFDADGYPTGFYPSDIWPEPPEGAVEITKEQWRRLLRGGAILVEGEVEDAPPKTLDEPEVADD